MIIAIRLLFTFINLDILSDDAFNANYMLKTTIHAVLNILVSSVKLTTYVSQFLCTFQDSLVILSYYDNLVSTQTQRRSKTFYLVI